MLAKLPIQLKSFRYNDNKTIMLPNWNQKESELKLKAASNPLLLAWARGTVPPQIRVGEQHSLPYLSDARWGWALLCSNGKLPSRNEALASLSKIPVSQPCSHCWGTGGASCVCPQSWHAEVFLQRPVLPSSWHCSNSQALTDLVNRN